MAPIPDGQPNQQRKMTREEFEKMSEELCFSLAQDLDKRMVRAFDTLTEKEKAQLDTANHPYFIARALGMVVLNDAAENCLNVEAIQPIIKRAKKNLSRR